jgi:hypothetical protein
VNSFGTHAAYSSKWLVNNGMKLPVHPIGYMAAKNPDEGCVDALVPINYNDQQETWKAWYEALEHMNANELKTFVDIEFDDVGDGITEKAGLTKKI